jgi:hypothetical protein
MFEQFDARKNIKIIRDADDVARVLSHMDQHVIAKAQTPQRAALDYLNRYGHLLGISDSHLRNPFISIDHEPTDADVEYRLSREKHQFDMTTVVFHQTVRGLPIWDAGISVTMKHNPLRVVGARSTLHPEVAIKRLKRISVADLKVLDVKTLKKQLGLAGAVHTTPPLSIEKRHFVIYRHDARLRDAIAPPSKLGTPILSGPPTLPLRAVHPSIQDGQHYIVSAVYFGFDFPPIRPLYWVAMVEAETLSVLFLRPFIDNVCGSVFRADPMTLAGGAGPRAGNATLNRFRSTVTLSGLVPPDKGTQNLIGNHVRLSNIVSPKVTPPTKPAGHDFDFDARTNEFAAVNAYYNCDRVFRLVEDLGFSVADYFSGTKFPSPVDHRGHYDKNHPNGDEINAHCAGNASGTGIGYTCFSLADTRNLKNPIGIACDWRIVLHELLGHGILYNHIGAPRFKFAHSAGDSFAAIINDPDSKAPDRGATYPWLVGIPRSGQRRHDRTAQAGWGWAGPIACNAFDENVDPGGYNNEQILSSTMFRFYRAIGGDSADAATRRFAARMTCHIMLAAIQTLTPPTSPPDAAHFASALMKAELADWPAAGVSGGAYHKVIRWAFEKQGLYQPTGTKRPNNKPGAPPPVDVYIDDGRGGQYQFQSKYWNCEAIWNRRRKDGRRAHQEPTPGVTNYAYVKIKNRGAVPATKVVVRAFQRRAAAGYLFPDDWQPMKTARLAAADVPPDSSAEILVGPFEWVPSPTGQDSMLMVVSARGDANNSHSFSVGDSVPDWRLVPNDNNVGLRSVHPVPNADSRRLLKALGHIALSVKNPDVNPKRMTIKATLPPFLRKRGWRCNYGRNRAFFLEGGAVREVDIRLQTGRPFRSTAVDSKNRSSIEITVYADGIIVGGMSYPLGRTPIRSLRKKRALRRSDLRRRKRPAS